MSRAQITPVKAGVLGLELHPLDVALELCNFDSQAKALDAFKAFFRFPFFKVSFKLMAVFFKINNPAFLRFIKLNTNIDATLADIRVYRSYFFHSAHFCLPDCPLSRV